MKKWIWQFRTFLSNSRALPSPLWCIAGAVVMLTAFVSCRLHQQEKPEDANDSPGNASPIAAFAASIFAPAEPEFIRVIGSEDGGHGLVAEVAVESCDENLPRESSGPQTEKSAKKWTIKVNLQSVFGQEPLLFDLGTGPTGNGLGRIGDKSATFQHRWSPDQKWVSKVCGVSKEDTPARKITGDREFVAHVSEWIAQVAPDCELKEIHENGWRCQLPVVSPELASREIEQLKRVMVSTWSRQPYVITRRATVSLSLAKALNASPGQKELALDRVCKVISHSQNAELPLVMTSDTWRTAACERRSPDRFEAATIGLTKALNELELLRRLFESSSKLGVLTVRIPRAEAPSTKFIVSLKPEEDVTANLAKETSNIWIQRGASGAQPPRACWHPIFAQTPEMLFLAQQLDLAGDAPRSTCSAKSPATKKTQPESHDEMLSKYLAESVTSDTEFLLINGQAKMLRLPTGSYAYTIHAAPDHVAEFSITDAPAPEAGEESDEQAPVVEEQSAVQGPSTSGKIQWETRRPRPMIKNW